MPDSSVKKAFRDKRIGLMLTNITFNCARRPYLLFKYNTIDTNPLHLLCGKRDITDAYMQEILC